MRPNIGTHLTDEEALSALDEAAGYSPVIRELCRRLEARIEKGHAHQHANPRSECPVCGAGLLVEFDEGNDLFCVGVDKDA
jgi:hypothetical protein